MKRTPYQTLHRIIDAAMAACRVIVEDDPITPENLGWKLAEMYAVAEVLKGCARGVCPDLEQAIDDGPTRAALDRIQDELAAAMFVSIRSAAERGGER